MYFSVICTNIRLIITKNAFLRLFLKIFVFYRVIKAIYAKIEG